MGQRHAVRLTLCSLLCVVFSKYRFISNERQTGVHEGIAQVRGAMLDHVTTMLGLTGLIIARLQTGKGKHLGRTFELIDVTILRKNNRGSLLSNAGNGENRRV